MLRARNDRDVFVAARARGNCAARQQSATHTLLPVTILIGQDRGRIERTIGLIIDQSEMCSLAGAIVAPAMAEKEID